LRRKCAPIRIGAKVLCRGHNEFPQFCGAPLQLSFKDEIRATDVSQVNHCGQSGMRLFAA
jgi:hypothetical protein